MTIRKPLFCIGRVDNPKYRRRVLKKMRRGKRSLFPPFGIMLPQNRGDFLEIIDFNELGKDFYRKNDDYVMIGAAETRSDAVSLVAALYLAKEKADKGGE